jgi:hypothetical protein
MFISVPLPADTRNISYRYLINCSSGEEILHQEWNICSKCDKEKSADDFYGRPKQCRKCLSVKAM